MKVKVCYWLLVLISNVSFALEVKLTEKYYKVAPISLESLQKELRKATSISSDQTEHSVVGEYSASASIKHLDIAYKNGQCRVRRFELILDGLMTLPKLKEGKYPLKLQLAFDAEATSLKQHERKHELIWKTFLEEYEHAMKQLIVKDDESCGLLINTINKEMDAILKRIDQRNVAFDCASYGRQLQLSQCDDN